MHAHHGLPPLPAAPRAPAPYTGFADPVGGAVVTGWALDTHEPGRALILSAELDGAEVARVPCALPREDIRAAGIDCDAGGFRFVIPEPFRDGARHVLRLVLPDGEAIRFPGREGEACAEYAFRLTADDSDAEAELSALLREHGIVSTSFIRHFDLAEYLVLNSAAGLSTSAQCLAHFARRGRAALCPIALDWRFDARFYGELVPETARLDAAEAYLRWINIGLDDGLAPNRALFLKELGLADRADFPAGVDPELYRAFNPDVIAGCAGRWNTLRHMIEHGIPERRPGCPRPDQHPALFLAAADRLASRGHFAAARGIYEQAVAAGAAPAAGWQHYADCLLRLGDHYAAERAYLHVLEAGAGNIWTELNLAKSRRLAGRVHAAAAGLAALHARLPGDVAVAAELRETAAAGFETGRDEARRLAGAGFLEQGRARMAEAVGTLLQSTGPLPAEPACPARAPRVLALVADLSLPQCRLYRVEQKLEQLAAAGCAAQSFDAAADLAGFAEALPFLDAVIFYRVAAVPAVVDAIAAARRAGIVTFYELDDLLFDPAHFPDGFDSYRGQISAEVYGDLVTGTELFRAAMSLCDYALASTPALAERMRPHVRSGRAFVHRNALGAAHLRALEPAQAAPPARAARGGGPVRVFYGSGTRAGQEDFALIAAPALAALLDRHGDAVELVLMGHVAPPPCLARHAGRIRLLPPVWDVAAYWSVLSGMDVNLAVLKDCVLSDCKSEIKWIEAAMFAIPSVVSATATYREMIEHGATGLLARDADEWLAALSRLVEDAGYRAQLGRQARDAVQARYGGAAAAANLRDILRAVAAPAITSAAISAATGRCRKRVLLVHVFFPPQDVGGATRVVADNLRDLARTHADALEFEVFTTTEGGRHPYAMQRYTWNGIPVTAVTAGDGPRADWEPDDPRMAERFTQVLDRFQPDLVHFHCIQRITGAACRAVRARGIPYFVTVHDGWWISDHQFLLDPALQPSVYNHADPLSQLEQGGAASFARMTALFGHLAAARAVLAVSEPFAALHRACGLRNVLAVPNGVPEFARARRAPALDGRVRLGFLGGIAPHKGYHVLKAALLSRPYANLALTVVDHALYPGGEAREVWGGVPVRFVARTPQAEIGRLYAETDVLLAPSVWPESFGLVAREALQAGCWIVASDQGAMAADLTPRHGFVADVRGIDGLRDILGRIDGEPDRYRAPPPPCGGMRTAREQAEQLAALYLETAAVTRPPPRAGAKRPRAARLVEAA